MEKETFIINTLSETQSLAEKFVEKFPSKGLVNFHGSMGVGKTSFISCFITHLYHHLDIPAEIVTSPTYGLVHEYQLKDRMIAHFDLYRLETSQGIIELGFDDYLENALCLVEWPEKGGIYTENPDIKCEFFFDNDSRHLTVTYLNAYK